MNNSPNKVTIKQKLKRDSVLVLKPKGPHVGKQTRLRNIQMKKN